jgi:hypothetical protein
MQTVQRRDDTARQPRLARQAGYGLAIGINTVLLWVVQNLGDWGWPSFVTAEWTRVRWIVSLSIAATILANVLYIVYDAPWVKALGDAGSGVVSVMAAVRLFTDFPFDFTGYAGPWSLLVRFFLIVAIVGGGIGVLANLAKAVIRLGSR